MLAPPFSPEVADLSAHVPMMVGHTLNEGGGISAFSAARDAWTDADVRRDLTARPTPISASIVDALREAYPDAHPVELFVHATSGLGWRRDAIELATRKVAMRLLPSFCTFCVEDTGGR